MTSETRTFIEFKDVVAIQFECGNCGAKASFPIGRLDRNPMVCVNCHEEWFISDRDPARAAFSSLVHSLALAAHTASDLQSKGVKLSVRLEVSVHEESLR